MKSEQHTNYKDYLEAQKVADEINSAIEEHCRLEECPNLKSFLAENSCNEELIKRLTSVERHQLLFDAVSDHEMEKDVKKFASRLKRSKRTKMRHRKQLLILTTSVAAVLCFVSFLFVFMQDNQFSLPRQTPTLSNDYSVPTLILDNGENLSLVQNELNIENKCYSIKKTDENKLQYTTIDQDSIVKYNKLIVPSKFSHIIVLSDGTEITVNAGSQLSYPIDFKADRRVVELVGEAYFKVAKSEKPFIVKTKNSEIKVYGTEFNVTCRANRQMETVLIEGSIGLTYRDNKEIMLRPNQRACYNEKNSMIEVTEVRASDYCTWKENLFLYNERPFKFVLSDFEAWYGVQFNCKEEVASKFVTFRLSRNNDLAEILKFIEKVANVKFIRKNKTEYDVE